MQLVPTVIPTDWVMERGRGLREEEGGEVIAKTDTSRCFEN